MIDLYFWNTPNGYKPLILLEELGLNYSIKTIHIGKGEQFAPEFLAIAPNNRIPAIVDHSADGQPLALFESGAILQYLAEKHAAFLPEDTPGRWQTLQWLYWQMGGFGPMLGQNHHFSAYAPEKIDYAIQRYVGETQRLYGVLNKQLAGKDFITGEYSIADMACWPWSRSYKRQSIDLDDYPHVKAWFARIEARPAVQRAYEKGEAVTSGLADMSADDHKALFQQNANTVKG